MAFLRLTSILALLLTTAITQHTAAAVETQAIVKGKSFDRFVVIVLENTDDDEAKELPYLASLYKQKGGVGLSNYMAATHPSQPNYIYMIAGSRHGILLDFDGTVKDKKTIVDLLEAKNISWKAYMEGYQGVCNKASSIGEYRRKHNPFISFTSITDNPTRCAKIVPATQLEADIKANAVPQFVFYTPDMRNDGHDTSPQFADDWLKSFLEPKLSTPAFIDNTAVLVTYDEAENYFAENRVWPVLIGGAVKRKSNVDSQRYTHFSILKTVEDNWGLGNLGLKDVDATPFVVRDTSRLLRSQSSDEEGSSLP